MVVRQRQTEEQERGSERGVDARSDEGQGRRHTNAPPVRGKLSHVSDVMEESWGRRLSAVLVSRRRRGLGESRSVVDGCWS